MKRRLRNLLLMAVLFSVSCYCYQDHLFLPEHYLDLPASEIETEIQRLLEISRTHKNPRLRARSHLVLARLYFHRQNPRPDYPRAIEELETYLSQNPDISGGEEDRCRNLIDLLREIQRLQGEKKVESDQVAGLNTIRLDLQEQLLQKDREIETLKKEMEGLRKKIEQLDRLYFRIHKKKKKDRSP